jgi:hypothetical protein
MAEIQYECMHTHQCTYIYIYIYTYMKKTKNREHAPIWMKVDGIDLLDVFVHIHYHAAGA